MGFLWSQLFKTPPYPEGNFAGKTVVVTGSNTGLGREAARHFARMGTSRLILAVRSLEKGNAAKQAIESTTSCKDIQVWQLDMSSRESVQAFAHRASTELNRIDIFLANAGVARSEFNLVEGYEETIAVNVIYTFLLAALMMPKLKETANKYNIRPTFTVTGSDAYVFTKFPHRSEPHILSAMSDEEIFTQYSGQQYPASKLLELWIVRAITKQHPAKDLPVTLNIVTPGLCHSDLGRDRNTWSFWLFKLLLARSTEVGSRTLVHAGASGEETHGKYLIDCGMEEPGGMVTGKEGREVQDRVAKEILEELESIQPGVTKNFE